MKRHIDFYFDFISIFGYFAHLRMDALAEKWGCSCSWHPILLSVSVMKVMGFPPILSVPLKGEYLRRDAKRYMKINGIELGRAVGVPPMNPLPAARAFYAVEQLRPDLAKAFAREIYRTYWIEDRDASQVEILKEVASKVGIDARLLEDMLASGEAAALLRDAVQASLARGVFGSPFFIVDDEPFFGVEKMEFMEQWIAAASQKR